MAEAIQSTKVCLDLDQWAWVDYIIRFRHPEDLRKCRSVPEESESRSLKLKEKNGVRIKQRVLGSRAKIAATADVAV